MSYFLGIDLGTSSLKILIGDEDGNIMGSFSHSYEVVSSNEYYSEQDPYSWINGFNIAFSNLLSQFPFLKKEHLVMSFSGQMHSLVLIDNQGNYIDENGYRVSTPVKNPYYKQFEELWLNGKNHNQNADNPSLPVLVEPEQPKKGVVYNEKSH